LSKRPLLGFAALFTILVPHVRALDLQQEIAKEKALLAESVKKERDLLRELEELAEKIENQRREMEMLSDEIARREIVLRRLEKSVKAKDQALKHLENLFRERLKVLAMTGNIGWLNLLFTPGNISTTLQRSTYFQILITHDQNVARRLLQEKEALVSKKQLVATEKKRLVALKEQLEKEVATLKALKEEKEIRLAEVRRNMALYCETLENLERAYQAIQKLASELKAAQKRPASTTREAQRRPTWASPVEIKGLMPPPVEGVVLRFFGLFHDPQTGRHIFQPGIFIGAPAGVPVSAPYAGRIAKISLIRGQGVTVFIDHGYDFLSIIGGLGKVEVSPGAEVKTGDIIGEVGELPFGESGVYYELRYRGKLQNPLDWLDTTKLHFLR